MKVGKARVVAGGSEVAAGNGVDGGSGSAPQAETKTYKSSAIPATSKTEIFEVAGTSLNLEVLTLLR